MVAQRSLLVDAFTLLFVGTNFVPKPIKSKEIYIKRAVSYTVRKWHL